MLEQFKDCKTINDALGKFNTLKANFAEQGGAHYDDIKEAFLLTIAEITNKNEDEEAQKVIDKAIPMINKILDLCSINIELLGSWVWVSGKTYEVREELKSYGFTFSRGKMAWYFKADDKPYKRFSKKSTLPQIRNKYQDSAA